MDYNIFNHDDRLSSIAAKSSTSSVYKAKGGKIKKQLNAVSQFNWVQKEHNLSDNNMHIPDLNLSNLS